MTYNSIRRGKGTHTSSKLIGSDKLFIVIIIIIVVASITFVTMKTGNPSWATHIIYVITTTVNIAFNMLLQVTSNIPITNTTISL